MKEKIPVGLLGATGTVGQRFVQILAAHPWFDLKAVTASDRSLGKAYAEAAHWRLPTPLPEHIGSMRLLGSSADLPCRIVFSALDAAPAAEIEPACARQGKWVFSNASAFRMESDVPLLIPEVNAGSLEIVKRQRKDRGWTGALVTNANCSTMFLAMALAPLHRAFRVQRVFVTTLQAISGAGYPGVAALDILGNVIPDIPEEAAKIERETAKILGDCDGERISAARMEISAQTYRVAVEDGHTESVSVGFERKVSAADVIAAWTDFRGSNAVAGLPTAPESPIVYRDAAQRPQPRRDVETARGMSTVVGGLRPCPILDWKFTVLGHNTVRGAAGASVLNAEYAVASGWLA